MRNSYPSLIVLLTFGLSSLFLAGCSREARKAGHLGDGDRYFAAGQYELAEIEYLNVLKTDALNARAISQLGIVYFEQGRLGRAFSLIFKARELEPNNLTIREKSGRLLFLTGNHAEARKEAIYILEKDPRNAEAPVLLADASIKPPDVAASRQRLTQLPAPIPESAPVLLALGTLEAHQDHLDAAEELIKRALLADPKSDAAYASLGALYLLRRDPTQAEAALKKAFDLASPRSPRRLLYPKLKVQTGDINGGRQILEEIVKQTPDYLPPWILLAEIAASAKKYDSALELVEKVLTRDPMNPEALLLNCRILLAKGSADKAVDELEKMLKLYPKSPQVYYQLGMAHAARRDLTKAAANLGRATSLAPDYPEATLALAEINLRRGDYISSVAALKPLVLQHPEIAPARMLLAEAYRNRGDLDSALAEYRRMEELFPRMPQVHLLKGTVLAQQNKRDAAREAFAKALELAPDYSAAVEQLVDLDVAEKNFEGALRRVDALIALNPKAALPYLLQAKIYSIQQNVGQAEAVLRKAIELQPDSPAAYLMLARLYVNSKQAEKALQNFQAVVAKDPKHVESWMLIGLIYDQQKNYAGARDAYEKLLAVNPDFASALNNLACLYSDHLDQQERAAELAQHARELLPNEPHIADSLGWILYKQRQYPRALGLLRESAFRLSESAAVQFHLGMAAYAMGDDATARQRLQRALELEPTLPEAETARSSLAVLAIDGATAGPAERATLEKLSAAQPDDPAILARLAAIYERGGESDRALRTAEAALKANPSNVPVLMQLVRMQVARNDRTKAFALAKEARKLADDDADIAYELGRLAYQLGDYRWAASLLQEAALKMPGNPDVLYDFAEAAFRVGQIADADASARRALAAGGLFLRADDARRLVEMYALAATPAKAAEATATIEQVLRAKPDYLPALFASGVSSEQRAKPEEAKRTYEKIMSVYPDFTPAQRRLTAINAKKTGEKK